MGIVAVVGDAVSGVTLRVYDESNHMQSWTANHGATVYAVAADSSGNVFIGGAAGTGGYTVRKYALDGSLIWSYDHGATVYAVAIDPNGNLFIGGDAGTGGYEARKLSADGTTSLWGVVHGATVYGIAAFADNSSVSMVLTGAQGDGSYTTRCYFTAGSSYWNYNHGATTYSVVLKNSGVFVAGASYAGVTTRYLYSTGSLAGSFDLGATARTICNGDADDSGSFYLLYAGDSTGAQTTVRHFYSIDSLLRWTANHGATVYGSTPNANGDFYTVGADASGVNLRKYSATGTLDTNWNLSHGGTLYAVAWSAAVLAAQTLAPGLLLSVLLAVPTFVGVIINAPALIVPLALSAPTITVPPLPPDWTGPPPQTLYRVYITGGAELLEVSIAALQCKRRLGDSTWLVLELPTYSPALAAAIAARPNGQLVVYAGVRSAAGVETMGEMMRAWWTETEITREAYHAGLKVTGRIVPTAFTAQTRTLRAIETQSRDTAGRWTVRCAVDPLLRPNDTALFGVLSMTVGAITYRIAPNEAWMDVEQVAD